MEDALKENLLVCEGLGPRARVLAEAERAQIAAQMRDRLYVAMRRACAIFAVVSAVMVAGFKFDEEFFDARSLIGIKMRGMDAQGGDLPSQKINVRTNFRDEKKSRLVIRLPVPVEDGMVDVCEEFTQDKYVITLREYSENIQNVLELVSDSTIMEAVGVYRHNDDVVVEVYCRDAYDYTLETANGALAMNFGAPRDDYAAKAVIWLPYGDKNRLALPEWRQGIKKFADDNNIRLYMASDMQEKYTQSDVAAFANRIGADMVLGVEVDRTDGPQPYITGFCNTLYFIPDYNSTHLSIAMTETFSETMQIKVRGFGDDGEYALVSEARVPVAAVRISVPQKDMDSIEAQYKLNQKMAAALEDTMGGILDSYLKMEEKTGEG